MSASNWRVKFANLPQRIAILLLLSSAASPALAFYTPAITTISSPSTSYISPATVRIDYSTDVKNNSFVQAELRDETGNVIQPVKYNNPGSFTLTGVTASHTYRVTGIVSDLNDVNHGAASAPLSITVSQPTTTSQTINFPAPAGVPFDSSTVALSATASSGLPVSFSTTSSTVCSISGSTMTKLSSGSCYITASQAGNASYTAAPSVTWPLVIRPGPQTISFATIANQTMSPNPLSLSVSASSGLTVSLSSSTTSVCTTSGYNANLVAPGTCTITASQDGNANYSAATPVVRSFTVSKANQSISFTALGSRSVSSGSFGLSASASSGLVVSFSTGSSACSVSGSTVNLLAVGTCSIYADQAGNGSYNAAPRVIQSFSVTGTTQTISFSALSSQTFGTAPFSVFANASSGLPVSFSSLTPAVCTVTGATVALVGAGSCTIAADQGGNSTYSAAAQMTQSFAVIKASQSINFGALPALSLSTPTFTLSASSSSGLPVAFSSGTSGICTVSGSTVTLLTTGTCTIAASQSGNANYNAAAQVIQSGTVTPGGTPGNAATFVPGVDMKVNMRAGEPYIAKVTMKNSGSTAWSEAAQIRLGAQSPQDSRQWAIGGRALIPAGTSVTTGQSYTFSIPITAPTTPGTYNFQWKMVQDGVEWFGTSSDNVTVSVVANTGGPSATLSASPTNARMSGVTPVIVTLAGSGAESGRNITKLELFQGTGLAAGYSATPIKTVNGPAGTLTMNYSASLAAGDYWFKLRSTDDVGLQTDSAPVVVNVTNSSLLGAISGVRIDSANKPQLVGWLCQQGVTQPLSFQVLLDAPTPQSGGQVLTSGAAGLTTDPDTLAVQSQCGTPGAGHHFNIDLSNYTAQYAGHAIYVLGAANSGGATVVLPCGDNNCAVPGATRIAMNKPADLDQYAGPTTVFMNAQITGSSAPFDEVAFGVDGSWIAGTADTALGAYYATSASLTPRGTPYRIEARVRQGNTTVYTMPSMVTIVSGAGVTLQSITPAGGSSSTVGTPLLLSVAATGIVPKSVQFYANGILVGPATSSGTTWSRTWAPAVTGSYILTSQAYDASGLLVATSAGVNVSVTETNGTGSSTPIPVVVTVPHLGNKDAGSLPGNLSVDKTGAAKYSIGIVVPPGTSNMQPELALNYSSTGTNGVAGLGWTLSGTSSVHRCGKTIAQDGVNRSINFDRSDRLCLDGQRLVRVNAPAPADGTAASADTAYWAANGEYRTEIESFNRVTAIAGPVIAGASAGTLAFKVQIKDGKTKYYGCDVNASGCTTSNAANSYVAVTQSGLFPQDLINGSPDTSKLGQAVSWALSSIVDTSTNHIDFEYKNQDPTSGEYLLSQIRYGGNYAAGQSAYAAVRFGYAIRPDAWTRYIADVHNDQRNRLVSIQTYINTAGTLGDNSGTKVRDYTLTYKESKSSGRSLLTSIKLCATSSAIASTGQTSQESCQEPTVFDWGQPVDSTARAFVSATPGQSWGGASIGDCALSGSNAAPCMFTHAMSAGSSSPGQFHTDYFEFSDFENNGRVDILEKRIADPSLGYPDTRSLAQIQAQTASNPLVTPGTMQQSYRYFHNSGSGFARYGYSISTNEFFAVLSVADFNGDGFPDLLVSASSTDGAGGSGTSTARICLSPFAGTPPTGGNIIFDCAAGASIQAIGNNTIQGAPTTVDVVGDGRAAIYGPTVWSDTVPSATLCIQGTCWTNQTNLPVSLANRNIPIYIRELFPMLESFQQFEQMVDFSGTGKAEMVAWTKAYRGPKQFGYDPSPCPATNPDCLIWHNTSAQVIINAFSPPGTSAPHLQSYTHSLADQVAGQPGIYNYMPYRFDTTINFGALSGDFNGSGYSSLFYGFMPQGLDANQSVRSTQAQGVQCLSTGQHLDCTARKALTSDFIAGTTGYMKTLSIADFDGDGQPDLLMMPVDIMGYATGTTLQLCHLLGDDSTKGASNNDTNVSCAPWAVPGISVAQLQTAINPSSSPFRDQVLVLDMLGTGRPQLVYYHAGTYGSGGVWQEDGRLEVFTPLELAASGQALDRIHQVTNGLGSVSGVTYVDGLATGTIARSGQVTYAYPQHPVARTGKIVGKLTVGNGDSRVRTTEYQYFDAAADSSGRGSLGFGWVRTYDPDTKMLTNTSYYSDWPYTAQEFSIDVIHGLEHVSDALEQGITISSIQLDRYAITVPQVNGSNTYCVVAFAKGEKRYDLSGAYVGEHYFENEDYDSWCNPISTRTFVFGDNHTSLSDVIETRTYRNDDAKWFIGLPLSVDTTKYDAIGNSVSRHMLYAHDSNTGLLTTETAESGNTALSLLTTYDRSGNKFGLPNKKIQSWTDPACQGNTVTPACSASKTRVVTDITYDTTGRFPSVVKNALGHGESHIYDAATGAMVSLTGPNGLTTKWTVDGYGRVTDELQANSNDTRYYFKVCQDDCPLSAAMAQITDTFHGTSRVSVPKVVYSDNVGHELRALTWSFDGRKVDIDKRYDSLGRLAETDQPRFDSDAAFLSSHQEYDDLNRVTKTVTKDEAGADAVTTIDYQGVTTVKTNPKKQVRTETRNILNQLLKVEVQDTQLNVTTYTYEPFGNLATTTDPNGNKSTIGYDILGRKTSLTDPDLGLIQYFVDPIGQTWAQSSPNQRAASPAQKTYFVYDLLGRMTSRWESDLESHWVYDTAMMGIGQLARAYTVTGTLVDYDRQHTYDSLGRPWVTSQKLKDATYTDQSSYDAWSRSITQTYQRGTGLAKVFDTRYGSYGYVQEVERGNLKLWKVTAQDASSWPTSLALGNSLTQTKIFNGYTGRLEAATIKTLASVPQLQESYQYDALGNVSNRSQYWDSGANQKYFSEDFTYDKLNRLWTSHVQSQPVLTFTYDVAGNILTKTGTGTGDFSYPAQGSSTPNRPHAVQSIAGIAGTFGYDLNGNQTLAPGRGATWTSFDMPLRLTKGSITSDFTYGPEHQRTRQVRSDGSEIIYAGAQEVETKGGQVTVKTYWPMGIGVEIDRPGSNASELNWMHSDRLGSIIALTDQSGNLVEKLEYDVWGKRRLIDGSGSPDSVDGQRDYRGFTGHEMLDQLDLVHMNGRVYDPAVGKFLSGDPFVQDPTNGQNYNRYSYVLNNPTNLTDPTGFLVQTEEQKKYTAELNKKVEATLAAGGIVAVQTGADSYTAVGSAGAMATAGLKSDGSVKVGNKDGGQSSKGIGTTLAPQANGVSSGGMSFGQREFLENSVAGPGAGAGDATKSNDDLTGSNGRSSNLKGQLGVDMRLEEINSIKGAQVLARNVTIVTDSGVRFQSDLVWKDPLGAYHFDEVKFGPSSSLTGPQRAGLAEFTSGKWTVAGERAIEAGLKVGEPMGGIPSTRFGGWSLRGFGGADTNKMWEKIRRAWGEGAKYQSTD